MIEDGGAEWSRASDNHAARGAKPLIRVKAFEMASTRRPDAHGHTALQSSSAQNYIVPTIPLAAVLEMGSKTDERSP